MKKIYKKSKEWIKTDSVSLRQIHHQSINVTLEYYQE